MNVDELDLTIRLVYGTSTPGADPNTHIREDGLASKRVVRVTRLRNPGFVAPDYLDISRIVLRCMRATPA
jgi:hypothetical protein